MRPSFASSPYSLLPPFCKLYSVVRYSCFDYLHRPTFIVFLLRCTALAVSSRSDTLHFQTTKEILPEGWWHEIQLG